MWLPKGATRIFSFSHKETQKCKVLEDVSLHKNIPTPEQAHELDSMCKDIEILCSLQFS